MSLINNFRSLISNDSDKVNLTSAFDDEYDDNTTPILEAPPPDIADTGLINRTETELWCKENFTFGGNEWAKHCYDDRHCKRYGDCCRDSEFYVAAEQTADRGGGAYNNSRYGCYTTNVSGGVKHALMIGRCPRAVWTEPEIREKCEYVSSGGGGGSPATAYPVTGDDTGHTYRNAYCAWCHGERRRVTYWKPVFRCSDVGADGAARSTRAENVSDADVLYGAGQWFYADYQNRTLLQCEPELRPPARAAPPRPCHPAPLVDGCAADGGGAGDADEPAARRCASYAYTVFEDGPSSTGGGGGRAFRNPDCARCNGVTAASDLRCAPPAPPVMVTSTATRFGFVSLLKPDPCGPDELYDAAADRCYSPLLDRIGPGACWATVKVGPDEYDARSADNGTVYVFAYRTRLPYQRLDLSIGGGRAADREMLTVCTEYASGPVRAAAPSTYAACLEWAGVACSAVSAVALLTHLAMFAARAPPRNLPEKNLASLSASLLLGYAGYLAAALGAVPAGPRLPCLLAALAIHFGFLSAFAWMSVMSADVWFVLRSSAKKLRVAAGRRTGRFAAYAALAWLVPAAFTALAAGLQASALPDALLPDLRPDFQRVCWFGNPRAQVALFVLPAGAAILANYVSFAGAVRLVATSRDHFRHQHPASTAAVSRSRANLRIYVRLSLMMGLAWAFGLAGAVTDNGVVVTVNTALNGLHGLFIFLAFDCDWTSVRAALARLPAAAATTTSSGCGGSDVLTAVATSTGTNATASTSITGINTAMVGGTTAASRI